MSKSTTKTKSRSKASHIYDGYLLGRTWKSLTEKDKQTLRTKGIINGCGGGRLHKLVPQFRFRACCDQHDFNYWKGGTNLDRAKADWQFFTAMLMDADRLKEWRAWAHITLAIVYYCAVRLFGWAYFNFREVSK